MDGSSVMVSSLEEVILPRKEVIQPHLPVRLPCYDFTPLTNLLAQWQPIVPAIVARVQPRT